jgi:hypothetical protein
LKHDLVEDIRNCPEIMEKIRADDRRYAQNLYASWCNMQWCPKQFWPILRQDPDKDLWGASWRGSGGIVADLRNKGEDYMDYYCSGMGGFATYDLKEGEEYMAKTGYVPEGVVSEEIAADLDKLGWFPVPYDDDGI